MPEVGLVTRYLESVERCCNTNVHVPARSDGRVTTSVPFECTFTDPRAAAAAAADSDDASQHPLHSTPSECTHPFGFRNDILSLEACNRLTMSEYRFRKHGVRDFHMARHFCTDGRTIPQPFVSIERVYPRDFGRVPYNPDMGYISDPRNGFYPQKPRVKYRRKRTHVVVNSTWNTHTAIDKAPPHTGADALVGSVDASVSPSTVKREPGLPTPDVMSPEALQRLEARASLMPYQSGNSLRARTVNRERRKAAARQQKPFSCNASRVISSSELRKRLDMKRRTKNSAVRSSLSRLGSLPSSATGSDTTTGAPTRVQAAGAHRAQVGGARQRGGKRTRRDSRRNVHRILGGDGSAAWGAGGSAQLRDDTHVYQKIRKLRPWVSEDGRMLERMSLPHQQIEKRVPNTVVDEKEQTLVSDATRRCVARLFDNAAHIPSWAIGEFEPMKTLYRGPEHRYVWYPLDLRERPRGDSETYHVYTGLVNRIDVMERIIQDEELDLELRRMFVALQDMHHMLCIFMVTYAIFCDAELRGSAVFGVLHPTFEKLTWDIVMQKRHERRMYRRRGMNGLDSVMITEEIAMARSNVWRQYRTLAHDCQKLDAVPPEMESFYEDSRHLFAGRKADHDGSFLDVFYPSYEYVFHEGELPDLTNIIRHSGLFGEDGSDGGFEDADVASLRSLIAKSIPLPMRKREMSSICAEKCEENDLVNFCMQRMTMATLGGYYSECSPTSFYVRNTLYRWFQFCPPHLDQFCAWLSGHREPSLSGDSIVNVFHKELVLMIVKEYTIYAVYLMPDLSEYLSKHYWFEELTYVTHNALEKVRQSVDDAFYGSGERWERFERNYRKYVSSEERVRVCKKLRETLGDRLWNRRTKQVRPIPSRRQAPRCDPSEADIPSATITRTRLPPGNINVYPKPKHRLVRPSEEQKHVDEHVMRIYRQALANLDVENDAELQTPDHIETRSASATAAAAAAAPRNTVTLVLPQDICNGIIRMIMDPISDRKTRATLVRAHYEPLAAMFEISIEWVGRGGDPTCTPLDVICDVVTNHRQWYMVQRALQFRLEHRTTRIAPHDPEHETLAEYRARWKSAIDEQAMALSGRVLDVVHEARRQDALHERGLHPGHEPAQCPEWSSADSRLLIQQFLRMYVGNIDEPIADDYRAVYSRLHGVSLVWDSSARCACPQCFSEEYSDELLYREFQQTVCSHESASVIFCSYTTALTNGILGEAYRDTLKYMYRATTQPFIEHVVEQMWIASEMHKRSAALRETLDVITEDEVQLIATVVARMPRFAPISMEWMACPPLCLRWEPIAMLRWARMMYESNTYTIDVKTCVQEMVLNFPREFVLLQQLFSEVHVRRRMVVYHLPIHIAQQQYATACKKFGIDTARGDPLPSAALDYYYCPAHGEMKRPIARCDMYDTMSFGHRGVAVDASTGHVYCTTNKSRNVAKAQGPVHEMRKLHAKVVGLASRYRSEFIRVDETLSRFEGECESPPPYPRSDSQREVHEHFRALDAVVHYVGLHNVAPVLRTVFVCITQHWEAFERSSHIVCECEGDILELFRACLEQLPCAERATLEPWLQSAHPDSSVSFDELRRRCVDVEAVQSESAKAMLRNMRDTQCRGPLPKINMMGRLFYLNGKLFMLCPYCLTMIQLTRESYGEFGISCNLCMATLKSVCPRSLKEFVRVVCFECGTHGELHRPEDTYTYVLLDDTVVGHRSLRRIYLCRKHQKRNLCASSEVMGLSAARRYIKMQVKRVRIGNDLDDPTFVLVDMATNSAFTGSFAPRHNAANRSKLAASSSNMFCVWSYAHNRPEIRFKSTDYVSTDVTERAIDVKLATWVPRACHPPPPRAPPSKMLCAAPDDASERGSTKNASDTEPPASRATLAPTPNLTQKKGHVLKKRPVPKHPVPDPSALRCDPWMTDLDASDLLSDCISHFDRIIKLPEDPR